MRPAPWEALRLPAEAHEGEPSRALDLETIIAGRWFNRVGIVALVFAVSFFLHFAPLAPIHMTKLISFFST